MTTGLHRRRAPAALLILASAGILWAGLTPFEFNPANEAGFDEAGPGLRFGGRGFAFSRRSFPWPEGEQGFGLEAWLRVGDVDAFPPRSIVTLDDGGKVWPLEILQDGRDIVVCDRVVNPGGDRWSHRSRFPGVLRAGAILHVAVSSSARGPRLYVDARPAPKSEGYSIPTVRPGEPFGGRLFLGATPLATSPWSGDVLGLAMYRRPLEADEVARHGDAVGRASVRSLERSAELVALYPFDECGGHRAADLVAADNPIELPATFLPPQRAPLRPPEFERWSEGWFVLDAFLNLAGFVPWGVGMALVLRRRSRWPWRVIVLCTVAAGVSLSLSIELAQHFAPTRDSALLDVALNALGALCGCAVASFVPS